MTTSIQHCSDENHQNLDETEKKLTGSANALSQVTVAQACGS